MLRPDTVAALLPVVALLALASVLAILAKAPSHAVGVSRLKLVLNTLGLVIIAVDLPLGLGMFVWGFAIHDKALIYFSFLPLVAAVATYRAITRRHRTWYGSLFGVNDSHETWRSFWDETLRVWGVRSRERARSAQRETPDLAPQSPPHKFSFSLNIPVGRADWLAPLIKSVAHRLDTGAVTVFPNALDFAVALDDANGRAHLAAFRQTLSVRRADGGALNVKARSDLPFLRLAVAQRAADGSYVVTVGLEPARLAKGEMSGAIRIETGDRAVPVLIVPVKATVT
jgi:hypothetical protein